MKKLTYSLCLLLASALVLHSCKKDFLDVGLEGAATPISDPNFAQNLVTGVYNSLLLGEAFGAEGDAHGLGFISATNILSDDADKGSSPADQAGTVGSLDELTHTPTNTFVQALWAGHYNGIAKANQALKALEEATKLDTMLRTRLTAEVRFIRGYYYFNLVRFYGGVPKVLRVPVSAQDANDDPAFSTRASVDEIYQVIIDDMQFAANTLTASNSVQKGRISKGTALAMLAKVYLYRNDYPKSKAYSDSVIQSQAYDLLPDYSKIWRQVGNNSKESVFELQSGVNNNSDYGINAYSMFQGPRVGGLGGWTDLGWGFCTPSTSLISAYEPGDLRKNATIIFIDNSGQHNGTVLFDGFRIPSKDSVQNLYYNYKAYHSENPAIEAWLGNRDRKQKNVHILRYADVLLMNAEAANELNDQATAIMHLNRIRQRAGLPNTTASTKAQVADAIAQERRIELALEHDRYFDLVRTGKVQQAMTAAGKNFVPNKHELLPIPSIQIALSGGKLLQNPNY